MSVLGLVFLIYGDSLTIQTRLYTREVLLAAGAAEVRYIEDYPLFVAAEGGDTNGRDSAKARRFFETQNIDDVDYVILNCGLHDMLFNPGGQQRLRQVTEDEYEANLKAIYTIIGDKLIWRDTFPTLIPPDNQRDSDDVLRYNMVARLALPSVKRAVAPAINAIWYDPDGVHLIEGTEVGTSIAEQIINGEIFRNVPLTPGSVITLDVPATVSIDPVTQSLVIKKVEE